MTWSPPGSGNLHLFLLDSGIACGRKPSSCSSHSPGRGEILQWSSLHGYSLPSSETLLLSSNHPHAGILQVRPYKTSPAFLFPHPCFSCHHNSSFGDNCIPFQPPREGILAFNLQGIPLETSVLQGHKETSSANCLKGLFVLRLAGAAVPFPAHFKSPFYFFFNFFSSWTSVASAIPSSLQELF